MLTVGKLIEALEGMDLDSPITVSIIDGPSFNAAYASNLVRKEGMVIDVCCYEKPRSWEGSNPKDGGDGTTTLSYEP